MNKSLARIMSFGGGFSCLSALVLVIFILSNLVKLPIFIPVFLLVAGILIVVFSLAYYTEK